MARVSEARTVTLDASGAGETQQLGPATSAQGWKVQRMTTQGNSAAEPTLTVHRGSKSGPVVDSTILGNNDVSADSINVFPGEYLTAAYANGTPGAVMVFYVEGETL